MFLDWAGPDGPCRLHGCKAGGRDDRQRLKYTSLGLVAWTEVQTSLTLLSCLPVQSVSCGCIPHITLRLTRTSDSSYRHRGMHEATSHGVPPTLTASVSHLRN